jgi:hypothetical protein
MNDVIEELKRWRKKLKEGLRVAIHQYGLECFKDIFNQKVSLRNDGFDEMLELIQDFELVAQKEVLDVLPSVELLH